MIDLAMTDNAKIRQWVAAAVMTAFCVFLFTYLLNLPFQLWPRF